MDYLKNNIKIHSNEYGRELRFKIGETIYILNTSGAIGCETTNEDLWNDGWRIGFTSISRFISPMGIYLFKATKERHKIKVSNIADLPNEGIIRVVNRRKGTISNSIDFFDYEKQNTETDTGGV